MQIKIANVVDLEECLVVIFGYQILVMYYTGMKFWIQSSIIPSGRVMCMNLII